MPKVWKLTTMQLLCNSKKKGLTMKNLQKTLLAVVAAVCLSPLAHAELSENPKIAQTQVAIRDLWSGHIFWVRNVVVDALAHNKTGEAAAEKEVVANAK